MQKMERNNKIWVYGIMDRFGIADPRSKSSLRKFTPKQLAKMLEGLQKKQKLRLEKLKEVEKEVEQEEKEVEKEVEAVKKQINHSKKTIKTQVSNLRKSVKNDIQVTHDANKYDKSGRKVLDEKYHYKGGKRKTKKARKSKKNYWFF